MKKQRLQSFYETFICKPNTLSIEIENGNKYLVHTNIISININK